MTDIEKHFRKESAAQCYTRAIIPMLEELRQEDCNFEAILGYIERC